MATRGLLLVGIRDEELAANLKSINSHWVVSYSISPLALQDRNRDHSARLSSARSQPIALEA